MADSSPATSLPACRTLPVTWKTALVLAKPSLLVRQPFLQDSRRSQASSRKDAYPHHATFISCEELSSAKIKIGEHIERLSSVVTVFVTLKKHFHSNRYDVVAVTELARFSTSVLSTTWTPLQSQV